MVTAAAAATVPKFLVVISLCKAPTMGSGHNNGAVRSSGGEREELRQLSEDLRVMLPGAQVLFGFLLILPFTSSLPEQSAWDRSFYFVAFVSAATAIAFFIAPSAEHRLRWRENGEEELLETGNRLALVGTLFLSISVTAVLLLITKLLYGAVWGACVAVGGATTFAVLWYGLPLLQRRRNRTPR